MLPNPVPMPSKYQSPYSNDEFPYVINTYTGNTLLSSDEIVPTSHENEIDLWMDCYETFQANNRIEWIHLYSNHNGYYRQFSRSQMTEWYTFWYDTLQGYAKLNYGNYGNEEK